MKKTSFDQLKKVVKKTFDELPKPDKGWKIITREHLTTSKICSTCQFLYALSGGEYYSLKDSDYDTLQRVHGFPMPKEGAESNLNRQHLLNLTWPLRLLERKNPNRRYPVKLTRAGLNIAKGYSPDLILEEVIKDIKFAEEPWIQSGNVKSYKLFSIYPHNFLVNVLKGTEGWIDRDEYRFFVSHQRTSRGIQAVIRNVLSYRNLNANRKQELIDYERKLFSSKKTHQNWRDMDLHTFSLMSLGTSFLRRGNKLILSEPITKRSQYVVVEQVEDKDRISLRKPPEKPQYTTPPPIEANTGYEAETLVAKLLRADRYEVFEYTRFRGLGFDLWTKHLDSGAVYYVEVKSSNEKFSTLTLTTTEFQAAKEYGEHYLLFIVEYLDKEEDDPSIWVVQNPAQEIPSLAIPHQITEHRASRANWSKVAKTYNR